MPDNTPTNEELETAIRRRIPVEDAQRLLAEAEAARQFAQASWLRPVLWTVAAVTVMLLIEWLVRR